jgi:adenylate cyclase
MATLQDFPQQFFFQHRWETGSRLIMPRLFKAIILGFLIGIVGLLVSPFRFALDLEDNAGLGLLFRMRGARTVPPDVFVVSIEKESSENLNLPNNPDKWPRSLHARLIQNLVREGARVITFDLHFIEPRSAEDDHLFAKAIKKAGNIVLAEPLIAKEVPLAGNDGSTTGAHRIVKSVKPIDLFSRPAVSTAPFSLPRIPFKVNRYWTFQTGAGESPTLPVVAFQLFTLPVYEIFIQLIEKTSPHRADGLPKDSNTVLQAGGTRRLIRDIREIFQSEPLVAERMLDALAHSEFDVKSNRLLRSLIKMYAAENRPYINYYGPPRTITTIPYHQALKIRDGSIGNKQLDLKDKVVFVGLSEKKIVFIPFFRRQTVFLSAE